MSKRVALTCGGHTRPVVDLAFSAATPDGFFLISGCKDNLPMIRAGNTGDWIGTFEGHKGAVWGVAFNSTAQHAATASADFSAKIWNATTGDEVASISHPHIVKSVDFSSDCHSLATACNDKAVRVYGVGGSTTEATVTLSGHAAPARKAVWTGPASIASAGDDKTIRAWDVRTGATTHMAAVSAPITSVELTRGGTVLLVAYGDTVAKYDPTSLAVLEAVSVGMPVLSASLHPTEDCVAWGGPDGVLRVHGDVSTDMKEEGRGHFGPIHTVRISPDGEVVATGSEDGTVRLWQMHPGKEYGLWRAQPDDAAP